MNHNVSATASIYQPRRLRSIAYVMAGLVTFLYGFGYDGQKPNPISNLYKPRRPDRQPNRISRKKRRNYKNVSVDRLRGSRVRIVGGRASGRW